jgi:hypothetical protein
MHGGLLKPGIAIGQTSVAKYMAKRRGPPSVLSDDGASLSGQRRGRGSYVSCRIERRRRAKSARWNGLSMIGNSSTA